MPVKKGRDAGNANGASVCVCINVRRASRSITRIYDSALEPSGLKVTQFSVLANIMQCGPVNVSNLSRRLNLDRTTLVRNLKALESSGYLGETETKDPRERMLAVSEAGRKAVETALPHWQAVQKQVREYLGKEHLDRLGELVTALEGFPHPVPDLA